jgi:hypothetical protein
VKSKTVARLVGGAIIFFNLWFIGRYEIEGVMVLVLTLGVAVVFELLIVRHLPDSKSSQASVAAPTNAAPQAASRQGLAPRVATADAQADGERTLEERVSEVHWKRALEELEENNRRAGLWAKSFAEANGDEAIAKAKYLQARASELARAERVAAQEAARAAEAKRLAEEEAARVALQREYDAKPKGICPSCKQVILLNAEECPKCHATFGEGASWHVWPLRNET